MSKQLVVPLAKIGMDPDKPVSEIHMGVSLYKYIATKAEVAPVPSGVGHCNTLRERILQTSLFPQIGDKKIKKVLH